MFSGHSALNLNFHFACSLKKIHFLWMKKVTKENILNPKMSIRPCTLVTARKSENVILPDRICIIVWPSWHKTEWDCPTEMPYNTVTCDLHHSVETVQDREMKQRVINRESTGLNLFSFIWGKRISLCNIDKRMWWNWWKEKLSGQQMSMFLQALLPWR